RESVVGVPEHDDLRGRADVLGQRGEVGGILVIVTVDVERRFADALDLPPRRGEDVVVAARVSHVVERVPRHQPPWHELVAAAVAGGADDGRAAIVEWEEGDAAGEKLRGEQIRAVRLEDRRPAGAVQPDERARPERSRRGIVEQAGQADTVRRFESYEAAG